MPRFFVQKESIIDGTAKISGKDAYHIARSLRMAEGDEIYISDGEGVEYLARLDRIRDEECLCSIISQRQGKGEPKMNITLYMAYPKGDKLETVIQKAVELGATRIVPFESSRCIKRPKADKIEKQTERLKKIAEEAAKQCGRAIIPEVSLPLTYGEMLNDASLSELSLICYERESHLSFKETLKSIRPKSISVIVGCEGGFSPEEIDEAIAVGARSVSLGERILRCETAPSAALSMILYEYEL
jgi:16S rRNA (uracil1498-N3)-methyltransferase